MKDCAKKGGVNLKQLEKWIKENYGKKCEEEAIGCFCCIAWRTYSELKQVLKF